MAGKQGQRGFGHIRKLPSKRFQASYVGPDLQRHKAPTTFDTRMDAEAWLAKRRSEISSDDWTAPAARQRPITFAEFASSWMLDRPLKPTTRKHYYGLLERFLMPTFGSTTLKAISVDQVRRWHSSTATTTPVLRAHAFALLRSILGSAADDGLITSNPARIRGAGRSTATHQPEPLTVEELAVVVENMPDRLRLLILLCAWGGLRFGEVAELRRSDLDLERGVVRVRRGVTRVNGQAVVGSPKSSAGVRDIALPDHVVRAAKNHLRTYVTGRDGLLFPASADPQQHLAPSSLYWHFHRARAVAGRDDVRVHDLRHFSATMAARAGATMGELMRRLGHSSPQMAMRYQHSADARDAAIAAAMGNMLEG